MNVDDIIRFEMTTRDTSPFDPGEPVPAPPPALAGFQVLAGINNGNFTLGAGDPLEETITSVAGTDHGSASGYSTFFAKYDEASGEIEWVALANPGSANGDGLYWNSVMTGDPDGNTYAIFYGSWAPTSAKFVDGDATETVIAALGNSGTYSEGILAKLSPAGKWLWVKPWVIEAGQSSADVSFVSPRHLTYYDGVLYASFYGINEVGKTFQLGNLTAQTLHKTNGTAVAFAAAVDPANGDITWRREDGMDGGAVGMSTNGGGHRHHASADGIATGWDTFSNSAWKVNAGQGDEATGSANQRSMIVLRDLDGALLWNYNVDGIYSPSGAVVTPTGVLFIGSSGNTAARTWDDAGGSHVLTGEAKREQLVKYDLAGNFLWWREIKKNWAPGGPTHQGWQNAPQTTFYDAAADELYIAYNYQADNTPSSTWIFNNGEGDSISHVFGNAKYATLIARYDASGGSLLGLFTISQGNAGPTTPVIGNLWRDGEEIVFLARADADSGGTTFDSGHAGFLETYTAQTVVEVRFDRTTMTSALAPVTVEDNSSASGTQKIFANALRLP